MFEKFTSEARKTVTTAVAEAESRGDARIGTEHLLLGACRAGVLDSMGVDEETARRELKRLDTEALASVGVDPEGVSGDPGRAPRDRRRHRPFTGAGKRALNQALDEAKAVGSRRIGPEHITLAITRLPEHDRAIRVLRGAGANPADLRQALQERMRRAS
ncbi:MAG: Clp protease N-terminal domain-containing protein [Acidimicrobiia bacterium]